MRHSDQLTEEERLAMRMRTYAGLGQIVAILAKEYDYCPKCAVGVLLAAIEDIVDRQIEADEAIKH